MQRLRLPNEAALTLVHSHCNKALVGVFVLGPSHQSFVYSGSGLGSGLPPFELSGNLCSLSRTYAPPKHPTGVGTVHGGPVNCKQSWLLRIHPWPVFPFMS